MLTLNQITAQIQAVAAAHLQLASNGVGDIHEWQSKPDRLYPLLWIFHEGSDLSDAYLTNNFRLIVADRVRNGEEGQDDEGMEHEVLSDTQQIVLDLIAYFTQAHTEDYIIERTGRIEPFTERTDDRVAGNSFIIAIKQPWNYNKCSTPINK